MSTLADERDLLDVSDVARRIEDNWDEWKPERERPELLLTAVAASAAMVLCVAAGFYIATDRGHLKILRT